MTMVRGLLALLLLPFMMVPTAVQAHHPAAYGAEHCAVNTEEMDMIFIRFRPQNYARIEKRLNPGDCGIDIVGHCDNDWCPVRQGAFDGWMHRNQLVPMSRPIYCVDSVDLREGPGRYTKVVVSLHGGTCGVAATPFQKGHWVRVKAGGHYGWVNASSIY